MNPAGKIIDQPESGLAHVATPPARLLQQGGRRKVAIAAVCLLLFSAAGAAGGEAPAGGDSGGGQRIQVEADAFQAYTQENYAEFVGSVKAVHGSFAIDADRLRVYYTPGDSGGRSPLAAGNADITRIVASGNVRIDTDGRSARAEAADYSLQTRELVLMGPDATLSSDRNRISGSRITFNRDSGHVKIEGSGEGRVSGLFYPSQEGEAAKGGGLTPGVVFR